MSSRSLQEQSFRRYLAIAARLDAIEGLLQRHDCDKHALFGADLDVAKELIVTTKDDASAWHQMVEEVPRRARRRR